MTAPSDDSLLTPALAKAWGVSAAAARGPKPSLSAERIISAAIDVAAADGVDAVSMKRVASELGTGPMSLYRHISSKEELLSLMVDTAVGPPEPGLPTDADTWRSGITRWAWDLRARYQQHLWTMNVPIPGPPITPNSVRWFETALRCFARGGLTETEQTSAVLLVSMFVRSESTLTAQITAAMQRSNSTEVLTGYAALLRRLTNRDDFPAVTRVLQAGVFDADDELDFDFTFGLERILDGVAALTRESGAARTE